jgi:phosphoribosylglycinamide formyltransferase-1
MSARDTRVGILISGRGSNMVALLEAMRDGRIPARPAVVVANDAAAPGLARAADLGVSTEVVSHKDLRPRAEHERAVLEVLRRHDVDLVCLAGYMRMLSAEFVALFRNRVLNVHPALLPAFPGLDAQKQALEHGAKVSGCTVHFVDEQCDHGPIVLQAAVAVLESDTVESLSARILEQEHRIYPEAVRLYCQNRLRVEGRRVRIAPGSEA